MNTKLLTDKELRAAFDKTNTAEPLAEGWPGLERFAREVERIVNLGYLPLAERYGCECDKCGVMRPLSQLTTTIPVICNDGCGEE